MKLTAEQVRVLGCLVEKDMATPEYYPLSRNALTLACNQKSNREPVMSLTEVEVTRALDGLRQAGLAVRAADSVRTTKFAHNLPGKLSLDRGETALVGALLVRGPQTLNELRTRSERMHRFADPAEVESMLEGLAQREPPLLVKQARQPGQKEPRYMHLFGAQERAGEPETEAAEPDDDEDDEQAGEAAATSDSSPESSPRVTSDPSLAARVTHLESEMQDLHGEVAFLREKLRELIGPLDE